MTKATLKDYQVMLDCKDREITLLKFKLENFESLQRGKCCECEREAIQDLSDLHFKLMPFEDEYFKGLDTKTIAELAKKSIRITAENSKLEQILDEIKEIAENCYDPADKENDGFWSILQKISECEGNDENL